jgi:hypothetical protein
VFTQRFGTHFTLRFSGENLTDSDIKFTQGNETQRLYKLGRTIGVSVGFSVF